MPKNVAVLGSTGSIGANALDVISSLPQRLRVWGLTANTNWRLLSQQAATFRPKYVSMADPQSNALLEKAVDPAISQVLPPQELMSRAAEEAEIALIAVVGAAGLEPALTFAARGMRLALANKECLVMAGNLLMTTAGRGGAEVLPVDSEHSALFQAIRSGSPSEIRRVIITASGGPFLNRTGGDLGAVSVEEALAHPTWSMGRKITIDSATMVNKAFEVIEARWLFGLPPEKISVLVHPESVVHSMVEFADSSVIAQLSLPDMKLPIQYALTYPERLASSVTPLDLAKVQSLSFRQPDLDRFPCLALGFEVAREGGTLGAVFNAANEVAVDAFLGKRLPFSGIHKVIRTVIDTHRNVPADSLESILEADRWARMEAKHCL